MYLLLRNLTLHNIQIIVKIIEFSHLYINHKQFIYYNAIPYCTNYNELYKINIYIYIIYTNYTLSIEIYFYACIIYIALFVNIFTNILNFNHSNCDYTLSKQNFTITKIKTTLFSLSLNYKNKYTQASFPKQNSNKYTSIILSFNFKEQHASKKNRRKLRRGKTSK